jgi:AbrB family looped-hinge helix DNA binding protein
VQTVTVSQNFDLRLPPSICEALHIKPGQEIRIIQIEDRIELIPQSNVKQARGFLKGINTTIEREEDRL